MLLGAHRGVRAVLAIVLLLIAAAVDAPRADAVFMPAATASAPGSFVPMGPLRVLDTRYGPGQLGKVKQGEILKLSLAEGVVPRGAAAVVLNVTVFDPDREGYLSLFPWTPTAKPPNSSKLNFRAGVTIANLVSVKIGEQNSVAISGDLGPVGTHVIADLAGYYIGGTATSNGAYVPIAPARLFDTRTNAMPFGPGEVRSYKVSNVAGIPSSGVAAVFVNITVTDPTSSGYLTAYPADSPKIPEASNVNFNTSQIVPNLVMVKVSPAGEFSVLTHTLGGTVNVVADVAGYVLSNTRAMSVGGFLPVPPRRLFDTRQPQFQPALAMDETFMVTFNSGVLGIVANTTITEPQSPGYITVYPASGQQPTASNLNFVSGDTIPNLCSVMADGNRAVRWVNKSTGGRTHVMADLAGVYVDPTAMASALGAASVSRAEWDPVRSVHRA